MDVRDTVMDELLPRIAEEYKRWKQKAGPEIYTCNLCIGIHEVLRAHFLIVDYFVRQGEGIGGIGPKDLNILHSTLSRQTVSFGRVVKWKSDLDIAATLFYGLIKNHPFHDGNKRTAFLSLLLHLWKLRRVPNVKQKEFETLALRVASNNLELYKEYRKRYKGKNDGEVLFISNFLRRRTRRVNRRVYLITYHQLDTLLRRFGFGLENPQGNYIDVVRISETKTFFGKTRIEKKRLGHIRFPGWTRQTNVDTIKYVRKITGLTYENGVDADAFFHGADPLPSLIDTYHRLLQRLADK